MSRGIGCKHTKGGDFARFFSNWISFDVVIPIVGIIVKVVYLIAYLVHLIVFSCMVSVFGEKCCMPSML